MARLYDCKRWKDARLVQLRKEPLCRMCRAQNKFVPANEVDHHVPALDNPVLFWDTSNYTSLCKPCHSTKTYYETNRSVYLPKYVRPIADEVILLCGSPASGKSTWAKKQKGYTIIDLDDIKCMMSGQPMFEVDTKYLSQSIAIRNKMISETKGKVIVIATLANNKVRDRWRKDLGANLYITSTPLYKCLEYVKIDDRRKDKRKHIALVNAFFKRYKPINNEIYI